MTIPSPRAHRSSRRCTVCDAALDVHEAVQGGHCAHDPCRTIALKRALRARESERRAKLERNVDAIHRCVASDLRVDPGAIEFGVVPANERTVEALADDRREALRRHLEATVAEAATLVPTDAIAANESGVEEADAWSRVACATCRGHCCGAGAHQHAFLDVGTLRRFRASAAEVDWPDVSAMYLRHLPEFSYKGSCAFHGEMGCTLPRAMRSSVCNEYHCAGHIELQAKIAARGERTLLVIAVVESEPVRWSVHDGDRR